MKLKIEVLVIMLIGTVVFSGCKSLRENARFAKCEFKTRRISRLSIGGIETLEKKSINDFNLQEGLVLASQIKQRKLITKMTVDIQAKNPNEKPASLEGFQYVLVIDGKEIINDELKTTIQIPGYGESQFSVNSTFDLIKAAKDTGYDTLLRMALGLIDRNQQPVTFDLYFRPYLKIMDKKVKYPDFIKLSSVYQAGQFK